MASNECCGVSQGSSVIWGDDELKMIESADIYRVKVHHNSWFINLLKGERLLRSSYTVPPAAHACTLFEINFTNRTARCARAWNSEAENQFSWILQKSAREKFTSPLIYFVIMNGVFYFVYLIFDGAQRGNATNEKQHVSFRIRCSVWIGTRPAERRGNYHSRSNSFTHRSLVL